MAEDKITRICWNAKGWRKPSGRAGKSRHAKAYERKAGFGHEEWLLDTTKLVDGWHYGFLQPIFRHRSKYSGQTFNLSMYSIEGGTRNTRWWIGRIKDVIVITPEQSNKVYLHYKANGWLDEMREQLRSVGADESSFQRTRPEEFVVIKFRPASLNLLDTPMRFSGTDPAVRSNYYVLLNWQRAPQLLGYGKQFKFIAGHRRRKEATTCNYEGRATDIDLAQNRIQAAIYRKLSSKFGFKNVGSEVQTGFGSAVDLVVQEDGPSYIFYEIKTHYSARLCIREALGQLLEYAFYPNGENAKELIIVSDNALTSEAAQYLANLRARFKLPIRYQRYNPQTGELDDPA
jgi:hypothetical protein